MITEAELPLFSPLPSSTWTGGTPVLFKSLQVCQSVAGRWVTLATVMLDFCEQDQFNRLQFCFWHLNIYGRPFEEWAPGPRTCCYTELVDVFNKYEHCCWHYGFMPKVSKQNNLLVLKPAAINRQEQCYWHSGCGFVPMVNKRNNLFSAEVKKARRNLFNTHTSKKTSTSEGTDKQTATPRKKRRHASTRKCEGLFVGSLFLSPAEGTGWERKGCGGVNTWERRSVADFSLSWLDMLTPSETGPLPAHTSTGRNRESTNDPLKKNPTLKKQPETVFSL